jgi:Cellulase (glycosyl hydrolase family 5)
MARARLAGAGQKLGWRGLVAGSALALSAAAGAAVAAPAAHATPTPVGGGTACGKATGPFSVSGTQVLGAGGKTFISYGLTVAGLQSADWASSYLADRAEITATADDWCANTVRLQLNQDELLGPDGTGLNQAYLAAVKSEVAWAESDKLVVVLNDETNLATPAEAAAQRGPTRATEVFWKDLTKVYGHDPQVIFDLFNEPRLYSSGMSMARDWQLWLDGGTFDGVSYPFGMAQLADYVRTTLGARNLFWIEGPNYSSSFAGMVQANAVLKTSGVVYAVHHPAGDNTGSWGDDFGYLITDRVGPVVDGEWTNYEPAPTSSPTPMPSSCWPNAPTSVPQFLRYLTQYGIGLNAYTLQPGFLVKSAANLADPTTMNAKTWTCQSASESQPGQGAGAEILAWFQQQNS